MSDNDAAQANDVAQANDAAQANATVEIVSTFELLYEPITPVNPPSMTAESAAFPALPRAFRLAADASDAAPPPFTVPLALQGFFMPISSLITPGNLRLIFYSDPQGLKQLFNNVLAITTIGSGTKPYFGKVTPSSSTSVGFYDLPAQIPIGQSAFFGLVPNYTTIDPTTNPLEVRGFLTIQLRGPAPTRVLLSPQTRTINIVPGSSQTNEFIYPLPTPSGGALFNLS